VLFPAATVAFELVDSEAEYYSFGLVCRACRQGFGVVS
jgi:hypothetical protein